MESRLSASDCPHLHRPCLLPSPYIRVLCCLPHREAISEAITSEAIREAIRQTSKQTSRETIQLRGRRDHRCHEQHEMKDQRRRRYASDCV